MTSASNVGTLVADFEAAVSAHFKKASIPTLLEWFAKREDGIGTYKRIEIEEMWTGYQLAAADLREQAMEIERLIEVNTRYQYPPEHRVSVAEAEREALRAENEGLRKQIERMFEREANHTESSGMMQQEIERLTVARDGAVDQSMEVESLQARVRELTSERDAWAQKWHAVRAELAELKYPGMKGIIKPMSAGQYAMTDSCDSPQPPLK